MQLAAGGKHLLDHWSVLVRRRWIVYLSVALVTLTALVGSFLVTPLYRSTVTLQIERQNPDVLTFQDLGSVDYSWSAYMDFYQTQYKVISSSAVARQAVEREGLASHPAFASVAEAAEPGLLARLAALLPRPRAVVRVDPLDRLAQTVQASLEVSPVRNSHLVHVSWTSSDPDLAARVANGVADAYIRFNIESQHSTSGQAEEFLLDQIGQLRREIAEIEGRLQDYGEQKSILSVDDATNTTLRALGDIAARRTVAETRLAETEAAYRAARDGDPEALPEVRDSGLIARLREEYAAYEAEFSVQSRRFKSDWPEMQTLSSKLEQARERLQLEVDRIARQVLAAREADWREARAEVENLDALFARQQSAAQQLKRDAVEFTNYQSEVEKKRETLDQLVRRQGEMSLTKRLMTADTSPTNIKVLEPARPPAAPFRPNVPANLVLGLVLGLGLGVGAAFFLDYLDNTIASPQELERVCALPLLAVVPRHGAARSTLGRVRRRSVAEPVPSFDLVAHDDGQSPAAEAYRDLRTSLLLSNPGRPPRRLMVTSALPEEGKTATSINVATVLAQLGRRVALVDTDLRRPRLHRAFGRANDTGISTYLSGLTDDVAALAMPTPVEHLDLVPSGPIPPNPSEMLEAPRFAQFVEALLALGYEHVVFDSPPILSVADPVIIAQSVDSGILAVRAGRTPRQSVRLAAERLDKTRPGRFGVVLNDLDPELHDAGSYRYRYYGRTEERPRRTRRAGGTGG